MSSSVKNFCICLTLSSRSINNLIVNIVILCNSQTQVDRLNFYIPWPFHSNLVDLMFQNCEYLSCEGCEFESN